MLKVSRIVKAAISTFREQQLHFVDAEDVVLLFGRHGRLPEMWVFILFVNLESELYISKLYRLLLILK